jgi:uncharacterized membrane protein
MRRYLFWLTAALVLGLACHVAYILFVPSRAFNATMDAALGKTGTNSFTIMDVETHMKLMPFASRHHVVGVCKFDLAKGPVRLNASVPEAYWTLAVYTVRGQQVYSINDTQADTNTFGVDLSRSGGFLANVLGGGEDVADIGSDDLSWQVSMTDRQGLAIIWVALADPVFRPEAEAVLRKSSCARKGG